MNQTSAPDPSSELAPLTKKQSEILLFIHQHIESQGYAPSVREIGQAFKIGSPNGVMCHLKALEKKKRIKRRKGKTRSIRLVGCKMVLMPFEGEIK